ncbi:MAG: hypothetical protein HKN13_14800, partial [Rhodothermales bacterium]|nr:hypothetical protein [Rhodothermales bacterium]
ISAICSITLICCFLVTAPAVAQVDPNKTSTDASLSVFLDCDRCDNSYIRSEIDFVNYVRDRTDADIHLLITRESTGSGRRYTLNFIGLKTYSALNDTLYYASSNTDTNDERRQGLNNVLKMGLVRYVARTQNGGRLVITYDRPSGEQAEPVALEDRWNSWVFRLSTSGSFSSEESRKSTSLRSRVSANRVTDEWRIRLNANGDYRRSRFDLSDTTIVSTNRNGSLFNFLAKGLGEHWSIGASTYLSTSSFNNTDLLISAAPAIEYSVFPYSEFARREFRLEYRVGVRAYDYTEITLFDKLSETLLYQEFETILELRQPWGSSEISLDVFQFLHDFTDSKSEYFSVELSGGIDVRLIRGLSVSFGGEISWVKDQLSLPREDASEEDILLGSRRLPTAYEYGIQVGFSYTFGSIYNNVVNPRFGF